MPDNGTPKYRWPKVRTLRQFPENGKRNGDPASRLSSFWRFRYNAQTQKKLHRNSGATELRSSVASCRTKLQTYETPKFRRPNLGTSGQFRGKMAEVAWHPFPKNNSEGFRNRGIPIFRIPEEGTLDLCFGTDNVFAVLSSSLSRFRL